jgi:hypothetical protein
VWNSVQVSEGRRRTKEDAQVVVELFCGHSAGANSWLTPEQVRQIKKAAVAQIKGRINSTRNPRVVRRTRP